MKAEILIAAARFHALAAKAASNGGFWVSAAGGTANVAAGIIARGTGCTWHEAHEALDLTGGEGWYAEMAYAQPWPIDAWHDECPGRWDVKTIALAAVRPVRLIAA